MKDGLLLLVKKKEKPQLKMKKKIKKELIENTKKTELYKDFLNKFPDANLIDVNLKEE